MIENLREKRASELPTSTKSKSMDSNKILIFIEVAIVFAKNSIVRVGNNTMMIEEIKYVS